MERESESETKYVPDQFSFYRTGAALCIGTVELLYVLPTQAAGILTVLLLSSNDCDRPVRAWLWVLFGFYLGHVLFILIAELVPACGSADVRKAVGQMYLPVNTVLEGCILLWVLLGNVWFYDSYSSCKDGDWYVDYEEGFVMMFIIIVTYYAVLAVVGLALLVVGGLVCVGNAAANRAKYVQIAYIW